MNGLEQNPSRQTVVNGLAVVGFIALIAASMGLAGYATRFVPSVVGRIGSAAVYLGSTFTPSSGSSSSAVPAASTTIPLNAADSPISTPVSSSSPANETPLPQSPSKPAAPSAGKQTTGTYQVGGSTAALITPSGLPDLVVKINTIGYLATTSANSFVASSTVPAGSRPAVNFTIKNIGTNVSGVWRFSASIPTQTAYVYQSPNQQTLAPGDSIDYTLGFDQATSGANQVISITANFDRSVTESNMDNNTASTTFTVLGH